MKKFILKEKTEELKEIWDQKRKCPNCGIILGPIDVMSGYCHICKEKIK